MNEVKFNTMNDFERDCLIDILSFIIDAKNMCFCDYDGFGFYATKDKISDVYINFDDIVNNIYPEWATHVCWFNK